MSQEGYDNLVAQMEVLKEERVGVVADIKRAIEDNLGSQPVGPGGRLPGHRRIGVHPLRGRFRRQVKEALLA